MEHQTEKLKMNQKLKLIKNIIQKIRNPLNVLKKIKILQHNHLLQMKNMKSELSNEKSKNVRLEDKMNRLMNICVIIHCWKKKI